MEATEFLDKVKELVTVLHEMTEANRALPEEQRREMGFMLIASDDLDNDPEGKTATAFAVGGAFDPILKSMLNIIMQGSEEAKMLESVLKDVLELVEIRRMIKDIESPDFKEFMEGMEKAGEELVNSKPLQTEHDTDKN